MTVVLDDEGIRAIRARLAAIEGRTAEWEAESAIDTSSLQAERAARPVWNVCCGEEDDGVPVFIAENVLDRSTADFIAAAPRDMRLLLDLVESLRLVE